MSTKVILDKVLSLLHRCSNSAPAAAVVANAAVAAAMSINDKQRGKQTKNFQVEKVMFRDGDIKLELTIFSHLILSNF